MARPSTRGDLFINVGGDVTPLRGAMKAGQSVLNEFGKAAIDVRAEVDKAFAGMAANAPAEAKKIEQSFNKTFAEIRRNAQAVLKAPNGGSAVEIINAAGTRQAAAAAEAEAAALRQVADAAIKADKAAGGTNASLRVLAVSSEVAAREAQEHAAAMRSQAAALDAVEAEMLGASAASQKHVQQQGRAVAVTGQARMGMQQLGYQLGDISTMWALGAKPMQIFASQSGQVIQAFQLMGGEGNKFLSFLRGPWGIGLTVGMIALTPLIAKLIEGKDEVSKLVDKMREQAKQAELNRRADEAWKGTIEGLTDAIRKRREEQERQRKSDVTAERESFAAAEDELRSFAGKAEDRAKALEAAIAELRRRERYADSVRATELEPAAQGQVASQLQVVQRLRNELAQIQTDMRAAMENLRGEQATLLQREAGHALDGTKKKVDDLTLELDQLTDSFIEGAVEADAYKKRVTEIRRELEELQKAAKGTGSALPKVTQNEVVSLLQAQFGAAVSSTVRSPEQNRKAGGAANSYHLKNGRGFAIDFVPAGGMSSISKADIQAAADAAGLKILELLGPGDKDHDDHFHLAVAHQRLGPEQVGELQAQRKRRDEADKARRDRERQRKIDQDDEFARQMARLDEQLVVAQTELVTGIEAQARFAAERVDLDQQQFEIALQNAVNDERLRKEQADLLLGKAEALTLQRKANIEARRFISRIEEQNRSLAQETEFRIEALEYAGENADTLAEQRRIQLAIVDALYKQREADLKLAKAKATMAQDWDEVARIDRDIRELPTQRGRDEERARRGSMSPMEAYRDRLSKELADIQTRLEEIQVLGLEALQDDMAAAAVEALGLKGALGEVVGELIRLGLQMLTLQAIGGPTNGGNLLSGISKMFGGGRRHGGAVNDNEFYLVGEDGPELFAPGVSGTIIPNHVLEAARQPSVPRSIYGRGGERGPRGGRGDTFVQMDVRTPDANSFHRSGRQMQRDMRRRMGL